MKTEYECIRAVQLTGGDYSIRAAVELNIPLGRVSVDEGSPTYHQYPQVKPCPRELIEIAEFMLQLRVEG